MILCIDIGNTNVVTAIWDGEKYFNEQRNESLQGIKGCLSHIEFSTLSKIIISSVVPKLTQEYINKLNELTKITPFVIDWQNCNLDLDVELPHEVGADRICNSFAAKYLFGSPAVVVDFGSATTYDVIDENGAFIGGAIAPGIDISAHHLIKKTALLKSAAFQFPKMVVGRNTKTNLQSGIMFGGIDAINGMLNRIQAERHWDKINIILTGGFSRLISPQLERPHQLAPHLTLDGMRLIARESQ
ncbi:MAG: type III pantothenate kinase [Candidatus Marinimicrobia bacterium]|nr:type III pantothenate kinase [Candidatus Neomarinimicrobiota bacterium]